MKRGLLLSLLVVSFGCGSAEEAKPPTPEEAACADYCAAAKQVGCPKSGECLSGCMSLFELGCSGVLIDFLACAAPALTSECVPRDAGGKLTCDQHLNSYVGCVPVDVGVPFEACGPSTAESESVEDGCEGALQCDGLDLRVQCDAGGACTCSRNGVMVGTCDNIMSSAYFCAPHESCCTPFFAPSGGP